MSFGDQFVSFIQNKNSNVVCFHMLVFNEGPHATCRLCKTNKKKHPHNWSSQHWAERSVHIAKQAKTKLLKLFINLLKTPIQISSYLVLLVLSSFINQCCGSTYPRLALKSSLQLLLLDVSLMYSRTVWSCNSTRCRWTVTIVSITTSIKSFKVTYWKCENLQL